MRLRVVEGLARSDRLRRWVSRAFIVSIFAYLVVIAFLLRGAVTGASRWAPYGVNVPTFIVLIIASEVIIALTAAWIFKEDAGIWPASISAGWHSVRAGDQRRGLTQLISGLWDVSIVDLRLRTRRAILLARVNRIAALAPLAYALAASAGRPAPWGLRAGALTDVAITFGIWWFMEAIMVERGETATDRIRTVTTDEADGARRIKESRYLVRRVVHDDIERLAEIEGLRWGDQAARPEMIASRIDIFPQGQLCVVHESVIDGVARRRAVVAWGTLMPANDAQVRSFRTWHDATAGGTIRNADPHGNALVGVNLTSVTEGATYMLVGEVMALAVEWRKGLLMTGARLNGFVACNERRRHEGRRILAADEYAHLREVRGYRVNERRLDDGLPPMSDEEYRATVNGIRALNGETPLDDEQGRPDYVCSNLRGYLRLPGARMIKLLPGYFDDPASDDWGVLVAWSNPVPRVLRPVRPLNRWLAGRIRKEVRAQWAEHRLKIRAAARQRALAQTAGAAFEEQVTPVAAEV